MSKNLVPLATRLACIACLWSALGLADSWSGVLVDFRCWDSIENNTKALSTDVDRDRNLEIRLCLPNARTKYFAAVLPDGFTLKLDAAGNLKAAELIRQRVPRAPVFVAITGEANPPKSDTIKAIRVDSISVAR